MPRMLLCGIPALLRHENNEGFELKDKKGKSPSLYWTETGNSGEQQGPESLHVPPLHTRTPGDRTLAVAHAHTPTTPRACRCRPEAAALR